MQAIHYYFIRHGETEADVKGLIEGTTDTPLTKAGEQQMRTVGEALSERPIALLFTSDVERAWHSAEIFKEALDQDVDIAPVPEFREFDFGGLEGKKKTAVFKPSLDQRIDDYIEQGLPDTELLPTLLHDIGTLDPDGETERFIDFWSRIEAAMLDIHDAALTYRMEQQEPEINVVIVSHQFAIACFLHEVLPEFDLRDRLECGHYGMVTYSDGQYELDAWNEPR